MKMTILPETIKTRQMFRTFDNLFVYFTAYLTRLLCLFLRIFSLFLQENDSPDHQPCTVLYSLKVENKTVMENRVMRYLFFGKFIYHNKILLNGKNIANVMDFSILNKYHCNRI